MTDTTTLRLSAEGDFPAQDEAGWRELAEKALKGRAPESLERRTVDGAAMPVLGRETGFPSSTDPLGSPGTAPFIRGGEAMRDNHQPWDIRQAFAHPDHATTNAEILRDLQRGVTSVELVIDPTGENGVAIADGNDMAVALEGVIPSIATVALSRAGAAGPGLASAAQLALWAETTGEPKAAKLAFNIDPLGTLARNGMVEIGLDAAMARTATLVQALSLRFPLATSLRADGQVLHEAGGGMVIELAGLMASAVDTLRRLEAVGVNRSEAASQILFTVSVSSDYLREIAKLRAARRLWARCLEVLEVEPRAMVLQAVTSARMMTRQDPWVNMLRVTAATFAAGVGGADVVTALPFTQPLGTAEELARRVARNTQIIAQAESHLGKVADPAGGAWAIERHAEDLAAAAWTQFQAIEAAGGYGAALQSGLVQERVAADRAELRQRVATRKMPVTGTSSYPTLEEVAPPLAEPPAPRPAREISEDALHKLMPTPAPADAPSEADPLWPMRLAEPFERLRDMAARRGEKAKVTALCLGPLADYTARLDFARHLFASGGLALEVVEFDGGAIPQGTPVAVICGTDAAYGENAAAAAGALKAAGTDRIFLAGKPGEAEDTYRAAGISDFIFVGCDAIAALERAHAELGLNA
jgi:methylmalonyl-CoA mutase